MHVKWQDCELFSNNEVNDNCDLFHLALMVESEPVKLDEALSDLKWICAMKEELQSINKNKTWELVYLPQGKKPIDIKCLYRVKASLKVEIIKHKIILVAKQFFAKRWHRL